MPRNAHAINIVCSLINFASVLASSQEQEIGCGYGRHRKRRTSTQESKNTGIQSA
jgi:hypothetical protein